MYRLAKISHAIHSTKHLKVYRFLKEFRLVNYIFTGEPFCLYILQNKKMLYILRKFRRNLLNININLVKRSILIRMAGNVYFFSALQMNDPILQFSFSLLFISSYHVFVFFLFENYSLKKNQILIFFKDNLKKKILDPLIQRFLFLVSFLERIGF